MPNDADWSAALHALGLEEDAQLLDIMQRGDDLRRESGFFHRGTAEEMTDFHGRSLQSNLGLPAQADNAAMIDRVQDLRQQADLGSSRNESRLNCIEVLFANHTSLASNRYENYEHALERVYTEMQEMRDKIEEIDPTRWPLLPVIWYRRLRLWQRQQRRRAR